MAPPGQAVDTVNKDIGQQHRRRRHQGDCYVIENPAFLPGFQEIISHSLEFLSDRSTFVFHAVPLRSHPSLY